MSIHPIEATRDVSEAYTRYLLTAFHVNDRFLLEQIRSELKKSGSFVKGPYLEITAPYEPGRSLRQLVQEGILSSKMEQFNQHELPFDRPLYRHQEEAIRKIIAGRNVVVATGTGSGKTESFLIPIMDSLFKEKESGVLSPGVRALLIYPMNALANDQVKRMRLLLKDCPEVTFGRYTGETLEKQDDADRAYRLRNDGQKPLSNEYISREEMRKHPPHILITNYAMLEYLLLRPADSEFFDGRYSGHWEYVVLDEAHTYSGATGIEVSMLLRRLKDRVMKHRDLHGSIRCIATSATLGSGEGAAVEVMKFASDLFDESF